MPFISTVTGSFYAGRRAARAAANAANALYSFTTITFNNAGATGNQGPFLANCLSTYDTVTNSWLNDTAYFNVVTRGIQIWTVPETGNYRITAAGAAGGNNIPGNIRGGFGALITTEVTLTRGDKLAIVVGQKGADRNTGPISPFFGGSGGGGTFVYRENDILYYVVAGGGGGAAATTTALLTSQNTANGNASTSNGSTVLIQGSSRANGGINGLGGNTSTRGILFAGAGAGVNSDGQETKGVGSNGRSRANNWIGGFITRQSTYSLPGGFGGGGASGDASNNSLYVGYSWSGGGGGYSGGGGGGNGGASDGQYGGGGGSYWIGTTISSQTGGNRSNGFVTITKV
jgi:hypothetical protein